MQKVAKTRLKRPLKKKANFFRGQLSLNAGRSIEECLSTFIKLLHVINIFFFLFSSGRLRQVLL